MPVAMGCVKVFSILFFSINLYSRTVDMSILHSLRMEQILQCLSGEHVLLIYTFQNMKVVDIRNVYI
jgi:hypothetical protein